MKINIFRAPRSRFVAVPEGHPLPETWAGAKFFKTIDIHPDDERIGIDNAKTVLAAIEQNGFAPLGDYGA